MKKIRKFITVLLTLGLLVVTSGCGQQSQQSSVPTGNPTDAKLSGTIKLGMGFSLSGPYATAAKGHVSAMEMAVDDVNKSGLLEDAKFEIVREDSINTVATAINAFQKLVTTHKVLATFGPGAGDQGLAAIPIAQKAGIIAMSPNTIPQVPAIGDYVFGMVPIVPEMIPVAIDKVVAARKIKTVAILTQKDYPLAVQCSDQRRKEFAKLGVKILVDEEGLASDTDFTSIVTKIMSANPDMVIVDGTLPHDPLFIKQLKNAGFKGTIMGGSADTPPKVTSSDPQAFEGVINLVGWLPDLPGASAKSVEFTKRFKERFGFPPDQYSVGIYDNVWFLANAIKKAGTVSDRKAIRDTMTTIEYEGVQGKLKFDDKRIQKHTPALFEVKNGVQVPLNY